MNCHSETAIKVEASTPRGYLYLEDKVIMMQRIQEMHYREKKESLAAYGRGAEYDKMMKALSESILDELNAQKRFFLQQEEE